MKSKIILIFILLGLLIYPAYAQSAYGEAIKNEKYSISRSVINRTIAQGAIFTDFIIINNFEDFRKTATIVSSGTVSEIFNLEYPGVIIEPNNQTEIKFKIIGKEEGYFTGEVIISGDINEKIISSVLIGSKKSHNNFLISVEPLRKTFNLDEKMEFLIKMDQTIPKDLDNMSIDYSIQKINSEDNSILFSPYDLTDNNVALNSEPEIRLIEGSFQIKKSFEVPKETTQGDYLLNVLATYGEEVYSASTTFRLKVPLLKVKLFGFLPVWILMAIMLFIVGGSVSTILIRKQILKSKKYKMEVYTKTLPQKSEGAILLGKVAEKNIPAFLELDRLTTHAVVAGATGGGKSIAAQVLIEEALMKNISVIVFDPTAQWSGMLRKCDDKKMLSFYPKFGLKESDARAFPGNVRQIQNARQVIEIEKHIQPGHIQIFTLNKLNPSEMDVFVESVIVSIFKSDPKEHPGLKTMLVFDEVHRLLPKFGGSGKGFLQIERACREFRKWGLGVMLVSQVLSDFVGEIKANINTEVQMRTRDESDLNRLKTKYGEEVLQSLIKASVGVGMFVNPAYNKGKPYFINFRPILHNTRRLSDEVLEKYNSYGETIEDLEYQIEQLEKEKVDTFDLKMELKLVKDKLMTGNFTVVDIYLEGLKPRLTKQWEKIGKKPKKKELQLINEAEINESLRAAQKEREKWNVSNKNSSIPEKSNEPKDVSIKIVKPITFDNGMMVSSLKELKEILPNLDKQIFKLAVNDDKNDLADWVEKEVDSILGKKLKSLKSSEEILKAIEEFQKPATKENKKENEKSKKDEDKEKKDSKNDSKEEDKENKKENEKSKKDEDKEKKQKKK